MKRAFVPDKTEKRQQLVGTKMKMETRVEEICMTLGAVDPRNVISCTMIGEIISIVRPSC